MYRGTHSDNVSIIDIRCVSTAMKGNQNFLLCTKTSSRTYFSSNLRIQSSAIRNISFSHSVAFFDIKSSTY